jgi:hypothetical protein
MLFAEATALGDTALEGNVGSPASAAVTAAKGDGRDGEVQGPDVSAAR